MRVIQTCLKKILRFQEFWLFQYKNSFIIPVKPSLVDKAHFFLTDILQKYNPYLLIINVTTKMLEDESWKSKNQKFMHVNFGRHHYGLVFANLPITNGKGDFLKIFLQGVLQWVVSYILMSCQSIALKASKLWVVSQ